MDDQGDLSNFVRRLHDENNSKHKTICYDRFEHNLKDWTNLVKRNDGYYDELKLPIKTGDGGRLKEFWRVSIRELIDGVGRIHSKGLYHGGLGLESNYVFIGKCLKVINIKGDLDECNTDEDRENKKKKDITDLLGMLDNWFESIQAGGKGSWLECQHFFDFVNRAKRKKKLDYDEFVKKVVGHPFARRFIFYTTYNQTSTPTSSTHCKTSAASSSPLFETQPLHMELVAVNNLSMEFPVSMVNLLQAQSPFEEEFALFSSQFTGVGAKSYNVEVDPPFSIDKSHQETYFNHLNDGVGEKDCQNLVQFFGCPYSFSIYLPHCSLEIFAKFPKEDTKTQEVEVQIRY
ncbi:hypothetical protein ACE6H2_005680 [Prunus campanulata]